MIAPAAEISTFKTIAENFGAQGHGVGNQNEIQSLVGSGDISVAVHVVKERNLEIVDAFRRAARCLEKPGNCVVSLDQNDRLIVIRV